MQTQPFYQYHLIENDHGLIVFSHGFVEYSGHYMRFVAALNQCGYSVLRYDLRGHGRSSKSIDTSQDFVTDIQSLLEMMPQGYEPKEIIGMGFSFGTMVTLLTALEVPQLFSKLILMGTGAKIQHAFESLDPNDSISIRDFMTLMDAKADTGIDILLASNHPLILKEVSNHFLHVGMIEGPTRIASHIASLSIPVLMMHGIDDPMVPITDGLRTFESLTMADKSWVSFKGPYHDLVRSDQSQYAITIIETWLKQRDIS